MPARLPTELTQAFMDGRADLVCAPSLEFAIPTEMHELPDAAVGVVDFDSLSAGIADDL
jgi:hypothetical protein